MLPAAEKRANRFAFRPRGRYTTPRRFRAPAMNTINPSEPEAAAVAPVSPDSGSPILAGRVGRTLFWLALPVLAEQTLNMCVVFADIFLARFVGPEATVAVGLAGQFSWLAGILFGLVGTGATAVVARAFGRRDYDDANRATNQAMLLGIAMGIATAVTVILVSPWVPALFGLKSNAAETARRFIRIDGFGQVLWGALFIGNACLRGSGDTRTPLRIMAVVNVVNVGISAALSLGVPGVANGIGITGIAVGTACARTIGGVLVLLTLSRRGLGSSAASARAITLCPGRMRPHGPTLWRLLRIGVPAGADGLTIWVGQLLFVKVINGLATGDLQTHTYAAHIIGIRVESLSYLSAYAWAIAAATMVGQSLGAAEPARAARSGHIAAMQSAAIAAVLGVVYYVFAPQLYGLFTKDPRVMEIGVPAMRWLALFQIPCALMIVFPGALRGAGDTRFPFAFALIGMAGARLPLAYLGGHILRWGLPGAWMGMFADMVVRSSLNGWRFYQGGWKKARV